MLAVNRQPSYRQGDPMRSLGRKIQHYVVFTIKCGSGVLWFLPNCDKQVCHKILKGIRQIKLITAAWSRGMRQRSNINHRKQPRQEFKTFKKIEKNCNCLSLWRDEGAGWNSPKSHPQEPSLHESEAEVSTTIRKMRNWKINWRAWRKVKILEKNWRFLTIPGSPTDLLIDK